MKHFETFVFDEQTYERELAEFEQFLNQTTTLHEQADILPFFRNRKQLSARINYYGVLIIGRSAFLSENEQKRLNWRRRHFVVNSQHIVIYTFDQLLALLKNIPVH